MGILKTYNQYNAWDVAKWVISQINVQPVLNKRNQVVRKDNQSNWKWRHAKNVALSGKDIQVDLFVQQCKEIEKKLSEGDY